MAAAFLSVLPVLHIGWQRAGCPEVRNCWSDCRAGRNFQEREEFQCPRKPGIDKPPGKVRPFLPYSHTHPGVIWWVFRLRETIILSFPFLSLPSLKQLQSGEKSPCHPRKEGGGGCSWWHGGLLWSLPDKGGLSKESVSVSGLGQSFAPARSTWLSDWRRK